MQIDAHIQDIVWTFQVAKFNMKKECINFLYESAVNFKRSPIWTNFVKCIFMKYEWI